MRLYLLSAAALVLLLQVTQIGGQFYRRCESNSNVKRKLIKLIDPDVLNCPPLLGDDDDRYCCFNSLNQNGANYYCCDAKTFIEETGIGFILPILVSLIVAVLIILCVCCLCCPCCFWYKRRNRGAVYNTVVQRAPRAPRAPQAEAPPVPEHGPNSSVYQQQYPAYPQQQGYPMGGYPNMPMYYPMGPQGAYPPAVPPHASYPPAVPPHGQPMPPPYSEVKSSDPYSQQAPYNPNF